jgi:hypothetical protein
VASTPWPGEVALLALAAIAALLERTSARRRFVVRSAGASVLVAVLSASSVARASSPPGERPAPMGSTSRDRVPEATVSHSDLGAIDRALHDAESTARAWHTSWLGLFGAGVATRVTLALTLADPKQRTAQWVGAIPVAAGLLSQLLQPLPALDRARDLREAKNADEKRLLLARYAEAEAARRSPLQHILGIGLNAGAAAFLLFDQDAPVAAAFQLGVGAAVSELRIWTSPTAATDALCGTAQRATVTSMSAPPTVSAAVGLGTVQVSLRF